MPLVAPSAQPPPAISPPSNSSTNSGSPSASPASTADTEPGTAPPSRAAANRSTSSSSSRLSSSHRIAPRLASSRNDTRGADSSSSRTVPTSSSAPCQRSPLDTPPAQATRDPPTADPPTQARPARTREQPKQQQHPLGQNTSSGAHHSSARTIQATCAPTPARSSASSPPTPPAHAAHPPAPPPRAKRRLSRSRRRPPTQHHHPRATRPRRRLRQQPRLPYPGLPRHNERRPTAVAAPSGRTLEHTKLGLPGNEHPRNELHHAPIIPDVAGPQSARPPSERFRPPKRGAVAWAAPIRWQLVLGDSSEALANPPVQAPGNDIRGRGEVSSSSRPTVYADWPNLSSERDMRGEALARPGDPTVEPAPVALESRSCSAGTAATLGVVDETAEMDARCRSHETSELPDWRINLNVITRSSRLVLTTWPRPRRAPPVFERRGAKLEGKPKGSPTHPGSYRRRAYWTGEEPKTSD